ncbi:MAG: DUF1015 domain-containing protein [Bacteroidales bacterium]|nr:DUF1015 domain-containing protein [Bacteroidales bacterium]
MVRIKPFAAIRPPKELVEQVQARPYDVLNSIEARREAGEKSLLHITKPEIDFEPIADEHAPEVYDKAVENFKDWQDRGWLVQDEKPCYYVYAQTMGSRTQFGLVVCAHTDDYAEGRIKKHELTRRDKEDDRMKHVLIQRANIEPVFFAYPDQGAVDEIVSRYASTSPVYDFTAPEDGFGHRFWIVDKDEDIEAITSIFAEVPALYVADGHHRTAAAARVGDELRRGNPGHNGEEEYNWFMAVVFPKSQLKIIDYNRVVKDLNGLSPEGLVEALKEDFTVTRLDGLTAPSRLHQFTMYLDGSWYVLDTRDGRYDDNDPIDVLDVTILSRLVLDKQLGIKDLRTDKRIDFVGGIRGLGELSRRVDSGEMKVAFALYPVSMDQLVAIADSGRIMPPKTTWFEPKLRSGLTIHSF